MTKRYRDPMTMAYGIFTPGSLAREVRHENARRGLHTCHCCARNFEPEDATAVWYCSYECAVGDLGKKVARRRGARQIPYAEFGLKQPPKLCGCA